jgi:hypothetical protein
VSSLPLVILKASCLSMVLGSLCDPGGAAMALGHFCRDWGVFRNRRSGMNPQFEERESSKKAHIVSVFPLAMFAPLVPPPRSNLSNTER